MLHMSFGCGGYIGCRHMQRLRREGQARAARRLCCAAGRYALRHCAAARCGRLAAVELGGVPGKWHRRVHDSAGGQYYYFCKGELTWTNLKLPLRIWKRGNVEVDEETNCIIGAVITAAGEGTRRIGMMACNASGLVCAIAGARKIIAELFAEHPKIEHLVTIYELKETMDAMKGEKEQNEDE